LGPCRKLVRGACRRASTNQTTDSKLSTKNSKFSSRSGIDHLRKGVRQSLPKTHQFDTIFVKFLLFFEIFANFLQFFAIFSPNLRIQCENFNASL
jgi:hypothetical protein